MWSPCSRFLRESPESSWGWQSLAVLFILETYTWKEAAVVSAVRIVVIGFLFGNMFTIIYSLAGAALSLFVMTLMKKGSGFSILGISVAGGVSHNIGQLTVAALVVENSKIYLYLPALLISGTVTGVLLGFGAVLILNRLKR